jgi:hypothetical protein
MRVETYRNILMKTQEFHHAHTTGAAQMVAAFSKQIIVR